MNDLGEFSRLDDSTPSNKTSVQRGLDKRNFLINNERIPDIGSFMIGGFSSTLIDLDSFSWSQVGCHHSKHRFLMQKDPKSGRRKEDILKRICFIRSLVLPLPPMHAHVLLWTFARIRGLSSEMKSRKKMCGI